MEKVHGTGSEFSYLHSCEKYLADEGSVTTHIGFTVILNRNFVHLKRNKKPVLSSVYGL